ncbi:hypothetical protein GALMADRAFT_146654 [Galerina marginata CBS 339.88]|uniref:Uncharacterized protein n=1 Tax=Galerina marginata (strain CBS 339.88) TaxID=685588 RepID=A0A067SN20_GALM3|nr:hypothetical protein GALMADRAFT_146654 [Galerina marginata CBS 339.88]
MSKPGRSPPPYATDNETNRPHATRPRTLPPTGTRTPGLTSAPLTFTQSPIPRLHAHRTPSDDSRSQRGAAAAWCEKNKRQPSLQRAKSRPQACLAPAACFDRFLVTLVLWAHAALRHYGLLSPACPPPALSRSQSSIGFKTNAFTPLRRRTEVTQVITPPNKPFDESLANSGTATGQSEAPIIPTCTAFQLPAPAARA